MNYLQRAVFTALFLAVIIAVPLIGAEPITVTVALDGNTVTLVCQAPEPHFESAAFNADYIHLAVPASGTAGVAGGPALPAWSRWIEVPAGAKPVLNWRASEEQIWRDIQIAPFPTRVSDDPSVEPVWVVDETVYQNDGLFPPEPASVSEIVTIAGKSWALVDLTPYRANPARRELRLACDLTVEVTFEPDNSADGFQGGFVAPVYREIERALAEVAPKRDDLGSREDILGHYVIVIPDDAELIDILEPLIEWKKRKGYLVTVANMGEIGNRNSEIKNYLQEAWNEWDVPPTYVLLIGDANGDVRVPYFDDGVAPQQGYHISDTPYVQWVGEQGMDLWVPEGFVGRWVVLGPQSLRLQIIKLLAYERDPEEEAWVEGAVLIANGVHSCIETNVAIREMMTANGYARNDIHEAYSEFHRNERPDLNVIQNGINGGVGFVNFRGYNNWGDYYPNHIRQLANGLKLPIVTGMVCGTNDFSNTWGDAQPECRGEAFVRTGSVENPAGAVATFGPTDLYTHTWFNNVMDGEIYHLLLNRDVHTLGALCLAARLALLRNFPSLRQLGNGNTDGYYFYTYTILGDPGLQVWSKQPRGIQVNYADRIAAGARLFELSVTDEEGEPISGAYVHIYQSDAVRFGGWTDINGVLSLVVNPLEEGEYQLTVTGSNLRPFLGEFTVQRVTQNIEVAAANVTDNGEDGTEGNGDGAIGPGERVAITLNIVNTGSDNLGQFRANLDSPSPWVEFVQGEAPFPGIEAGGEAVNQTPFVIILDPRTPDGAIIPFYISAEVGEVRFRSGFNLETAGLKLQLTETLFVEDDLLPGTTQELLITIANDSEFDSPPITAHLYCADNKIQIRTNEARLGVIPGGERRDNADELFIIYAAENAYQGSDVPFGLLLTAENGVADSIAFTIRLGAPNPNSPQGPARYGYWAFDHRDTTTGMAPEYEWVQGTTRLNLSDANDGGANNYAGPHGSSAIVELPFEFIYFGQRYRNITISTNGWLAMGESDQVSWNNLEIGSPLAPPAQLCAYWDDLWDGQVWTRYDEDNSRFVVEWRNFMNTQGRVTFAVHLYDPTVVPTITGDGEFYYLYEEIIQGRDYPDERVTIGFSSPDRADGMTITHAGVWDPRTAGITDETVIRFTTGEFTQLGSVTGRVTNAATGDPMTDVRVMLDGTGFFSLTDAEGRYAIVDAPIGNYSVTAFRRHYNAATANVEIREDEVSNADFQLTQPRFNVDAEEIRVAAPPDSVTESSFTIWNDGNGPLDFKLKLDYEAGRDRPWDILFNIAATDSTDDSWLQGVAFDGENIIVAGSGDRDEGVHLLYFFDRHGNLIRRVPQYTHDEGTSRGYNDMDFNGENLLAVEKNNILEVTREGELVQVIPAPEHPTYSVAWSPERGTLFTKSKTGRRYYELDLDGNVISDWAADQNYYRSYGMAWHPADPDGFNLYVFIDNSDTQPGETRLQIQKLNLETGEIRIVGYMELGDGAQPQSCVITKKWDPLIWTFISLTSVGGNDRVHGIELGPNLTWISYDPKVGSVPPDENQQFALEFNALDMPRDEYYVVLQVLHNAVGDRYDLPIWFTVGEVAVRDDNSLTPPDRLELDVPHPNPFNAVATIRFHLPQAGAVTLRAFDLNGRLVTTLAEGDFAAGGHSLQWDAIDIPSGVYLIQLTSGSDKAIRKAVMMR